MNVILIIFRERLHLAGIPPIDLVADILKGDGCGVAEIIINPVNLVGAVFEARSFDLAYDFQTYRRSGFHGLETEVVRIVLLPWNSERPSVGESEYDAVVVDGYTSEERVTVLAFLSIVQLYGLLVCEGDDIACSAIGIDERFYGLDAVHIIHGLLQYRDGINGRLGAAAPRLKGGQLLAELLKLLPQFGIIILLAAGYHTYGSNSHNHQVEKSSHFMGYLQGLQFMRSKICFFPQYSNRNRQQKLRLLSICLMPDRTDMGRGMF